MPDKIQVRCFQNGLLWPILGLVIASLFILSCKVGGGDSQISADIEGMDSGDLAVDVQDLTTLFPRDLKSGKPIPSISLAEVVQNNDAAPDTLEIVINKIKHLKDSQLINQAAISPGIVDTKQWHLIGYVIQPCFRADRDTTHGYQKSLKGPDSCHFELKLTFQHLDEQRSFRDTGHRVQLSYNMGVLDNDAKTLEGNPGRLKQLISGIQQIKALSNTTAKPLGIHYGLKTNPVEVAPNVKEFLKTNLSQEKLLRVAYIGPQVDHNDPAWVFLGFYRAGLTWMPEVIPQSEPQSDFLGFSFHNESLVSPGLNKSAKGSIDLYGDMDMTKKHQRMIFKYDNPRRSNLMNTNCLSCHSTTNRVRTLEISPELRDLNYYPVAGISGFLDPEVVHDSNWLAPNFGYNNGRPIISTRTLNETTQAVGFFNEKFLEISNSGLDCKQDDLAKAGMLYQCVHSKRSPGCFNGCSLVNGGMPIKLHKPAPLEIEDPYFSTSFTFPNLHSSGRIFKKLPELRVVEYKTPGHDYYVSEIQNLCSRPSVDALNTQRNNGAQPINPLGTLERKGKKIDYIQLTAADSICLSRIFNAPIHPQRYLGKTGKNSPILRCISPTRCIIENPVSDRFEVYVKDKAKHDLWNKLAVKGKANYLGFHSALRIDGYPALSISCNFGRSKKCRIIMAGTSSKSKFSVR